MILVIAEQRDGSLNRASWEAVVGAQDLAASTGQPIAVAILGSDLQPLAEELAGAAVAEILVADVEALSSSSWLLGRRGRGL